MSSTHVERLVKEFSSPKYLAQGFLDEEAETAVEYAATVANVSVKLRSALKVTDQSRPNESIADSSVNLDRSRATLQSISAATTQELHT